jgi:hypothetical protein
MPRSSTSAKMTPTPATGAIGFSDINNATRAAKNVSQTSYKSGYAYNSQNSISNLWWYMATRAVEASGAQNAAAHGNTEFSMMDDGGSDLGRGQPRVDGNKSVMRAPISMSSFRDMGMIGTMWRARPRSSNAGYYNINDGAVAMRGYGGNNLGLNANAVWSITCNGTTVTNVQSDTYGGGVTNLGTNGTVTNKQAFCYFPISVSWSAQSGGSAGTIDDFGVLISSTEFWGCQIIHQRWWAAYEGAWNGHTIGNFFKWMNVWYANPPTWDANSNIVGTAGWWAHHALGTRHTSGTYRALWIADFRFGSGQHWLKVSGSCSWRVRIPDLGIDLSGNNNHHTDAGASVWLNDGDARYQKVLVDVTANSTYAPGIAISLAKGNEIIGTDDRAWNPQERFAGDFEEMLCFSTGRNVRYNRNSNRMTFGSGKYVTDSVVHPHDWNDQTFTWPNHMSYHNNVTNQAFSNHFTKHKYKVYAINEVD